MILHQYYLGCLAHASYLIGDETTGTAVIVDPQRDVDQYLEDAKRQGLTIKHVFLTHFHADFLAGHLELRDRAGAKIHLGPAAEAEFAFDRFGEGSRLELGRVRLEALETPGHTPEAISILVYDLDRSADHPYAALTGDTLFIGDVGRPDLLASVGVTADQLAAMLYDSLHEKLLRLPDETLVYPAHGAGSLCGKNMSKETVSTMGVQRRYNYALQPMSKEDFVRLLTTDLPDSPQYFAYDAALNKKERAGLEETLARNLRGLSLAEFMERRAAGAQVIDTREANEYAMAYVPGSLNVPLSGQYATWAGTLLDPAKAIVVIADPGREQESEMRLGRIGFDRVEGYLEGGIEAAEAQPGLLQHTDRITAVTVAEEMESAQAPLILDVRAPGERQQKRIEGSLHIPLSHLRERLNEIPRDRPIVAQCASGYRSSIAASLLRQNGFTDVRDLVGGLAAWEASRLAVVS
ncbi:MAG TPA: MBL fold metallo-hydrolase [Candidatus Eisenbacteria bacterium]|nr:MBL fold metallo-hydrolase [Candidatus Eisenbacteria bacterium]